jgi:hypothetical protein
MLKKRMNLYFKKHKMRYYKSDAWLENSKIPFCERNCGNCIRRKKCLLKEECKPETLKKFWGPDWNESKNG